MEKFDNILSIYEEWGKYILEEFFESEQEIEVVWGSDFNVYPSDDIDMSLVEIGMLITEESEKSLPQFFLDNFDVRYDMQDIEIFTICFLHEMGHLCTMDRLEDGRYVVELTPGRDDATVDEYRMLPEEFRADKWANEYINDNLSLVSFYQDWLNEAYSQVTKEDLELWTSLVHLTN